MKGKTPTKAEQAHMDKVRELGCIVCRNEGKHTPPAIHHIDGKTKPGAHFLVLPLCYYHHQDGIDCNAFTSFHPWKARFEERYGTQDQLLEQVKELLK